MHSSRYLYRIKLTLFTILLVFALSPLTWAATYYVDATGGNDSNSGLSESSPWKTIAKVNASKFNPGDQILFKKGEVWRETLIPPSSGTSASAIVFGAYGTGNKPSIRGSDIFTNPSVWTYETGNTWYISSIVNDPVVFVHDGSLGTRKSSKNSLTTQWDYSYDASTQRFYIYSANNPGNLSSALEITIRPYAIGPQWTHYVTFDALDLRHSYTGSWLGWGSTNVTFQNCNFTQSAGNHLQFHNGSNNGKVINSTFDQWNIKEATYYAIQTIGYNNIPTGPVDIIGCQFTASYNNAGSDHTAIMNDQNSWIRTIQSNTINGNAGNLSGDGIVIWRPAKSATSLIIENNDISEVGGIAIAIQEIEYYGASPSVRIRRNYITNPCLKDVYDKDAVRLRAFSQLSDVELSYNILNSTKKGNNSHAGISINDASGVNIYNNVIFSADYGIYIKPFSSRINVKNNIFMNNRKFGINIDAGSSILTFDYNSLYGNLTGNYNGISPGIHDVTLDPNFKNPTSGDFHLNEQSPCRDSGTFVGLTRDMDNQTVPSGKAVDIGAYEFPDFAIPKPLNLRILN